MTKRVIFISQVFSSKRDLNGNCYHALTLTRAIDGKSYSGRIDCRENHYYTLRKIAESLGGENLYLAETLPIREFQRLVKDWSYLGCSGEEIIENCQRRYETE
jgi:hypothetical protein